MRRRAVSLLAATLLLGGCGAEVVIGDAPVASLVLEGDPVVDHDARGRQHVSGHVRNLGDLRAEDVRVTVTTYVCCTVAGRLYAHDTLVAAVADLRDGRSRLHPGGLGFFDIPIPPASPPVEAVFVEIDAWLPHSGSFFFFTPGLIIIVV
jgi:hypothetical protein